MGILDKIIDSLKIKEDDEFQEENLDKEFDQKTEIKQQNKKKSFFASIKNIKRDDEMDDYKSVVINVVKPISFDESKNITDDLLMNKVVFLNLEGLDIDIAQRILDYISGTCYAIKGNLKKITNYLFLVAPNNVNISGALTDMLSGKLNSDGFEQDL